MRTATVIVGMMLVLMPACTGTPAATATGSGTGPGSSSGPVNPGCSDDSQCISGVCDPTSGNCCASVCQVVGSGPCSIPFGCDDAGLCVYAPIGTYCGGTCQGDMLTSSTCNGKGGCVPGKAQPCSANFGCNSVGISCNTACVPDGGCKSGYSCQDGGCVLD